MVELKTLKDFCRGPSETKYGFIPESINPVDVRQEVINWIKKMEDNPTQELCDILGVNINLHEMQFDYMIKWIKHFFNITDEELKGGQ